MLIFILNSFCSASLQVASCITFFYFRGHPAVQDCLVHLAQEVFQANLDPRVLKVNPRMQDQEIAVKRANLD